MIFTSSKHSYLAIFLFGITLGLYYPSLINVFFKGSVISIEDNALLQTLNNHDLTVKSIFQFSLEGKYCRPFIYLTFLVDQKVWGDNPFGYRLTNVIFHTLNVVLLFYISINLLKEFKYKLEASLFASLIFSFHPASVEAISWISGRTDPVATFWSLCAILFYLLVKKGKLYFLPLSLMALTFAVLSKEIALATPILIAAFELYYCQFFGYTKWRFSNYILTLFIVIIPVYFVYRSYSLGGSDLGLSLVASDLLAKDPTIIIEYFFGSYGFYIKKLIYPYPLNMTITTINLLLYSIIGFLVLVVFLFMSFTKRMGKNSFFMLWILLPLGPAVLISFTDIAWTPWAERYLYFSLAPFSILTAKAVLSCYEKCDDKGKKHLQIIIYIALFFLAISSLFRSSLMNDDERLWADTYRKSPHFITTAAGYAGTLIKAEKLIKAEIVLNKAMNGDGPKHEVYILLGNLSKKAGTYDKAESFFNRALVEIENDDRLVMMAGMYRMNIFKSLASLDLDRAKNSTDQIEKKAYYLKAISNLDKAYVESADAFNLYNIAKLYLLIDESENAAEYLKKFILKWQKDGYSLAAAKLLQKVQSKQ